MSEHTPEHDDAAPGTGPDFTSATAVAQWFGREAIRLVDQARREKSIARLRALSSAIDTWAKLYRLSTETEELDQLRSELNELRAQIESERRSGPTGVVKQ